MAENVNNTIGTNFFYLTLDTSSPQGVSLIINGGIETVYETQNISYVISCSDKDTTNYQMKMWGTAEYPTEEEAEWTGYSPTGSFNIDGKNSGQKIIYVKIRDDVHNESQIASDSVNYYKDLPIVKDFKVNPVRISYKEGKNVSEGSFQFNEDIKAVKIKIVDSVDATHESGKSISTTNGSSLWRNVNKTSPQTPYSSGKLEVENLNITKTDSIGFKIYAKDINAADSNGDGVRIIKVFIQSKTSGLWSV